MKKSKRIITLKTKIMITTFIPVVVCFVIIGTVIFTSLYSSLQNTVRAEFLQISQKYSYSFENKIDSSVDYLSILVSELEMQVETGSADREALQKTVLRIFDDYNLIDGSSIYFEPNMYDGMDADYIGTKYGTESSGRICWYFYLDDGKTAYLPEALNNDREFDEPHYAEAKKNNKPIYTNPTSFEVDGKNIPMFTITYPIQDNGGNFVGAVTVDLFLDDIYTQLQDEKIYDTGYVIIANDKNRVIYSPRYEDIGKTRADAGLSYPLPSHNEASSFFYAKSIINDKDTLVTISSIYISQLDSTFYISVAAPLDEINASSTRMTILLIVFSLIIITVIMLLLYYLIGKTWAPLDEITESVNKIAGGDISARINGDYKGEFAVVKDSVNTMADSIESYIKKSDNSLDILKRILNGMDAYLYVSDPETDEILFINDNMKTLFHIDGGKTGQICWKVFQDGFDERCEFCPCYQLDTNPDKPIIWEEHNTVTKRYYRNTDRYIEWIGGKKVHLQHSVDITDLKMTTLALDRRLKQQAIMASVSQSFLSDTDIDTLIANALRVTGEFFGVAQVLYFKFEDDGVSFTCKNEWINPKANMPTCIGNKQVLPDSLVSYIKSLPDRNEFCLNSNDPALRTALKPYMVNFQNYISVPIFVKGSLYGALDIFREDNNEEWSDSDINLATLVSSLLSGVFDRHSMEEQLRRLSSIVESSPQYITCVLADGTINYANPALLSITGLTEADIQTVGLESIFNDQAVKEIKEIHIPKTIKNGTDNFELCVTGSAGFKRYYAFSSFTIGSTDNIGCIVSDITEIRTLESELITAKELAEQGSRSKSEFLSRMSHEIRTPLNAIIGMNTIALNTGDLEKMRNCHEKIANASRHLLGVINDILDMSKIEADKFDLSYNEFNFEKALMSVTGVINFRVEEKQQNLIVNLDPDIPLYIFGDELRLSQVITNLLSNAVKFTPEHGTIILSTIKADDTGDEVTLQIEISDNGMGISKEQQERLFNLFEQADGSISRKYGGTGLGLAISKRIVELMGGRIWIESELGKGSKFIFTVKAKKGKQTTQPKLPPKIDKNNTHTLARAPVGKNSPDFSGRTVLIAEDVEINQEIMRAVLEETDVSIDFANDGRDAVLMYEANPDRYSLILMDIHMPEVDGYEATRQIRALEPIHAKEIPIIAMTANVFREDIENCLAAGMNDHIGKPIDQEDLFTKLCLYMAN